MPSALLQNLPLQLLCKGSQHLSFADSNLTLCTDIGNVFSQLNTHASPLTAASAATCTIADDSCSLLKALYSGMAEHYVSNVRHKLSTLKQVIQSWTCGQQVILVYSGKIQAHLLRSAPWRHHKIAAVNHEQLIACGLT